MSPPSRDVYASRAPRSPGSSETPESRGSPSRGGLPCELEFGEYGRALVVDLEPALEDADRGGRVAAQPQRPAEVVQGVGVGQDHRAGRLDARRHVLAGRGEGAPEDRDGGAVLAAREQVVSL